MFTTKKEKSEGTIGVMIRQPKEKGRK